MQVASFKLPLRILWCPFLFPHTLQPGMTFLTRVLLFAAIAFVAATYNTNGGTPQAVKNPQLLCFSETCRHHSAARRLTPSEPSTDAAIHSFTEVNGPTKLIRLRDGSNAAIAKSLGPGDHEPRMFTQTWQLGLALTAVAACLAMLGLFIFSDPLPTDRAGVVAMSYDCEYERVGLKPSNPTLMYCVDL